MAILEISGTTSGLNVNPSLLKIEMPIMIGVAVLLRKLLMIDQTFGKITSSLFGQNCWRIELKIQNYVLLG
jgi:hypothetical protein